MKSIYLLILSIAFCAGCVQPQPEQRGKVDIQIGRPKNACQCPKCCPHCKKYGCTHQ